MRVVVLGGRGLIGAKTVEILRKKGHDVIAASTKTGVNCVTGEGLAEAFNGAEVVVDLTNSPSFEDEAVMNFFDNSTRNLLSAAQTAGIKHFVALSVVGTARLQGSGYFRAKQKQEDLIKAGKVPYTIVQATQFFEFVGGIADFSMRDEECFLSTANTQPMAADDVAAIMADIALSKPLNGTLEVAGPDCVKISDIVTQFLQAKNDKRKIVASSDAPYFGLVLKENSLVPADGARIGPTKFESWLKAALEAGTPIPSGH